MKDKNKLHRTSNIFFLFGIIAYLLAGFFTLIENISWVLFVVLGLALFSAAFYYRVYRRN